MDICISNGGFSLIELFLGGNATNLVQAILMSEFYGTNKLWACQTDINIGIKPK